MRRLRPVSIETCIEESLHGVPALAAYLNVFIDGPVDIPATEEAIEAFEAERGATPRTASDR
jgi:hypothetical protein